jgi:hypothetical protein
MEGAGRREARQDPERVRDHREVARGEGSRTAVVRIVYDEIDGRVVTNQRSLGRNGGRQRSQIAKNSRTAARNGGVLGAV